MSSNAIAQNRRSLMIQPECLFSLTFHCLPLITPLMWFHLFPRYNILFWILCFYYSIPSHQATCPDLPRHQLKLLLLHYLDLVTLLLNLPKDCFSFFLTFLKFYLFIYLLTYLLIYLQRGGGRKRGTETSMWGCLSCAPSGDLAMDLLVHRLALNPLSHTSQVKIAFLFSQDGSIGNHGSPPCKTTLKFGQH